MFTNCKYAMIILLKQTNRKRIIYQIQITNNIDQIKYQITRNIDTKYIKVNKLYLLKLYCIININQLSR